MERVRSVKDSWFYALSGRIRVLGELVMFSHSVFSLSFATLAFMVASRGTIDPRRGLLGLCAFLAGRTCANALNRVVDRRIDARNPRTAGRHLVIGSVSVAQALALAILSFVLLSACAIALGPLATALLPVAGGLFLLYSYTKRFTWACHLILGFVCSGASVGAWIAARNRIDWPVIILAVANAAWVAGFDIIYAIQDIDFDRSSGLHSIPARFGAKWSRRIAGSLHWIALAVLASFGVICRLGPLYYAGLAVVASLFAGALHLVKRAYAEHAEYASYTSNKIVSLVLLFASLGDTLLRRPLPAWKTLPSPFDVAGVGAFLANLPGILGPISSHLFSFFAEPHLW